MEDIHGRRLRQRRPGDRAQPRRRHLRHQLHLHRGEPAHRSLHDPRQRHRNPHLPLQRRRPGERHHPRKRHRDLHLRRRPPRPQPHRRHVPADAVHIRFLRASQPGTILPTFGRRRKPTPARNLLLRQQHSECGWMRTPDPAHIPPERPWPADSGDIRRRPDRRLTTAFTTTCTITIRRAA